MGENNATEYIGVGIKIVSLAKKSPIFRPRLQGSCLRAFLSCHSSDSCNEHVDEIDIGTDEEADRLAEEAKSFVPTAYSKGGNHWIFSQRRER